MTAALTMLAAVGICLNTTPVQAQDTLPRDRTHLRVPERDVINLKAEGSSALGGFFYKVSRDGVVAQGTENRYIVPAGRLLVITDFSASYSGRQSTTPRVSLVQSDGLGNSRYVWRRPEKIDSNGWGWLDSHWTGGMVVSARGGLHLFFTPESGNIDNIVGWIVGYEVDASPLPQ